MSELPLSPATGGFRLQYVEVFNWGTFDQHIWHLAPGSQNSLLTGANGSGKTTLVDAILTLLVPSQQRFYNQSSGAESKRERSEESYVLGAFSTRQSESGLSATTRYLREKASAYSILIGCFHNAHTGEFLCLAQVRWFANQGLKRAYFVAKEPLEVAAHLVPLDAAGQWKRRLKRETSAQEYDSFVKYSQAFSQALGLKSSKALSLFAQTVGIKVLGNLNDFIRTHMLEEINSEEAYEKLRGHYENLLASYQAIERARQQLALLQPVIDRQEQHEQAQEACERLQAQEAALGPYFAQQRHRLYAEAIHSLEIDLQRKASQIEASRQALKTLGERRTQLHIAIQQDEVHTQIEALAREIAAAGQELIRREKQAARYQAVVAWLDLPAQPTEAQFYRGLENCTRQLAELDEAAEANQQDQTRLAIEQEKLTETQQAEADRLASLLKRQNRLPMEQVRLRKLLAERLGLSEKALPFAAELMEVKAAAKADWARPLEQLLRPLGLSVLVPETHQAAAIESLHRLKLDGHLRLLHLRSSVMVPEPATDSVLHLLAFKEGHPQSPWLRDYVATHIGHVQVSGYAALPRYPQALNEKGLRKTGSAYERDDREAAWEAHTHILGWDNQETIRLVQRRLKDLEEALREVGANLKQRRQRAQELRALREAYLRLQEFEAFSEIDLKSVAKQQKAYQAERERLLKSSDHLRELQRQLDEVGADIQAEEASRDRQIELRGRLQSRLENYREALQEAAERLAAAAHEPWQAHEAEIEGWITGEDLKVSTIDRVERDLNRVVGNERTDKERARGKLERELLLAMQQFISPSASILAAHPTWTAETLDLQPELGYVPEFDRIYRRIKEEELPRYQARFKDWLNERLIYDIAHFKTALDNQESQIEESIETINHSLRGIRFNQQPETFIQLTHAKTRDGAIRDFKQMLREAMPDPGKLAQGDEQELEACFLRIKAIIEALSADEAWRKKVTDVRNWLEFAASERYRADEVERQYYEDSQSLSGGEKAKLAYTILASAIAYQFGIRSEGQQRRSFRFAVVDEAFSKVDPANAIYAMELFKQLDLQLMVVTPLDKINLAEPYIQTVHYVQNREKRNSEVFDLTLAELREAQEPENMPKPL